MTSPDDDSTVYQLSPGRAWFPSADGTAIVEVGGTDAEGRRSPVEDLFGADFLRRLTIDSRPRPAGEDDR